MTRFPMVCLALTILTGSGAAARAQDEQSPPAAKAATSPSQDAVHQLIRPGDRHCLRSTGSLIPPKPGHCLPVNGRSYSQEDLRRTGEINTADALRRLDPAIH